VIKVFSIDKNILSNDLLTISEVSFLREVNTFINLTHELEEQKVLPWKNTICYNYCSSRYLHRNLSLASPLFERAYIIVKYIYITLR